MKTRHAAIPCGSRCRPGLGVYETLGAGTVADEDHAELVRALSFMFDSELIDCDANFKHDPFEIEFEGVTPACFGPLCPADTDLSGALLPREG